jgi:drug/metabolite transporter (DMT)-like permease
MLKGLLLAAASGTLANTGVFLQKLALDSRRPGQSIIAAFKTLPWLAGFALLQGGWFAQVGALKFAPLYLVQPVVSSGIIALVLLARARLHEPVDARLVLSISAVLVGASLLAASSFGGASTVPKDSAPLAVFAIPLGVAVVLGGSSRILGSMRSVGLAVAAGILYGSAVALSKPVAGQLSTIDIGSVVRVASHKELYLVGAVSTIGLVFNQIALARGRASIVAPTVLATMTVLPLGLGVLAFGEHFPPYPARAVVWVGVAACLVGVVLLARAEGEEPPLASGEAATPESDASAVGHSMRRPPTTD